MVRKSKIHKRAKRYEKIKAKTHRAKHLGGPGKPDYQRGKIKGEVKNWSRPVHSGVIRELRKKGIREIESKSGFTKPAIKLAKKYGIKLFQKGRVVK